MGSLEEIDIEIPLRTIDAVIEEVNKGHNNESECNCCCCSGAGKIAFTELEKTAVSIHQKLTEIKNECDLHSQRWFNGFRTPNVETDLGILRELKPRLPSRFELLNQALSIQHNIKQKSTGVFSSIGNLMR